MTTFVLDVSVTMTWCFGDEASEETWELLERLSQDTALVPGVWAAEVANVLLVAERRKRLTRMQTRAFTTRLLSLPILVEEAAPSRLLTDVLAFGRDMGLAAYDTLYLDLAARHDLPLATLDNAMRTAARKNKVRILPSGS